MHDVKKLVTLVISYCYFLTEIYYFCQNISNICLWDELLLQSTPYLIRFGIGIDPNSYFPLVCYEAATIFHHNFFINFS